MNNNNYQTRKTHVSSKLKIKRKSTKDCSSDIYWNEITITGDKIAKKPTNPYISSSSRTKRPAIPINPYKNKKIKQYSCKNKGILKKGDRSCWWLTDESGTCNYSKTFNGPTSNGEKLLLKWRVNRSLRISWGPNQIYTYQLPENYDPWIYTHKIGDTTRLLKPYKF